jgi:hypothetical protein
MNGVSLVCTVHVEMGFANVSELRAILERIQPEVIFLEVPPAAFDDYYEKFSRHNLESLAVGQYRQGHQVKLVPVDLPTPTGSFFEFRRVAPKNRAGKSRIPSTDEMGRRLHARVWICLS